MKNQEPGALAAPSAPSGDAHDNAVDKYQLIVFKLGTEEYAIHIDQIKEVVLTPRITKMPQTPAYVKGVANIRGRILAIVDLEAKLIGNEAPSPEQPFYYTLVVESKAFNMGILVREVPDTITVTQRDIDETVNVVQHAEQSNYVLGIVKKDQRLMILIDLFQVLQNADLNESVKETLAKGSTV